MPSNDFSNTLATIAAKAALARPGLSAEQAVEFAWFSVDTVGDASIDDRDFDRHLAMWESDDDDDDERDEICYGYGTCSCQHCENRRALRLVP